MAISFSSVDEGTTQIEIEHRGWERLGDAAQAWRDRNYAAWDTLLPSYREVVAAG